MRRRRSRMPRARSTVQSFKKVINHAPASKAAANVNNFAMAIGVDSVAAGQTGPTDTNVPTGSVITEFVIQYGCANLVGIASFMHVSIQHLRSGQSVVGPNVIGGSPQRNQVFFQKMYTVGQDQNQNLIMRFKVPKNFQRVREGDSWRLVTTCDTIQTDAAQIIYKFYR